MEEIAIDRSWRGELAEDLGWLKTLMDLSTWGTSLSALWETWQQGKPGWQHVLRTAVKKHGYVVQLANPCPPGRGDEDDTLQDLWMQVQCRCHCGRGFATRKALRMHQMVMHSWRTSTAGYIHGATCPVCLQPFWTRNRLRIHLRYVSRTGKTNVCAAWLREFGTVEEGREDLPADPFTSLTGARRVEAVPLYGPKVFGAEWDDALTLEKDFLDLNDDLEESGVSFRSDQDILFVIGEEFTKAAATAQDAQSFYHEWEGMETGILLGSIFLWGMQHEMDHGCLRRWCELLSAEPRGRALLQLHDWAVAIQKAKKVHCAQPERLPYWGPNRDPSGMHQPRLPVYAEVVTHQGTLPVSFCSLRCLRAAASV